MRDPQIETIDLLDDGLQLFAGGGCFDAALGELRRRAQARQRVAQPVGHRGRHLADRSQFLGLHQLRAGLAKLLGHLREGACQVADFVVRARLDGAVQVARAHDGHGRPQLADRTRQATGNEPRRHEARHQRQQADRPEDAAFRLDDSLHLGDGSLDAELARLAVDLAVHRCEGGLQALHQLLSRREVCRLALPGIVQREDTTRDRANIAFDLAHAVREFDVPRRKPRSPAIEPVIHHLLGERKLPLGRRVAAQVAPDDLRLVEHGVFHFGVRARVRQALPQRLQRPPLQRVGPNRLDPHEQGGEDHQGEAQQELALEGHSSKLRAAVGGRKPPSS